MGIVHSCCLPRYDNPNMCHENHTSTPKTNGLHHRNLSAVFHVKEDGTAPNVSCSANQLDVNSATEEELMTLPGINRDTARNIVEHRRQIGMFKKVEDLALVSGVGATKLMNMRDEICVRRPTGGAGGSPDSSLNDFSIQDNVSRSSKQSQSRLGGATVFINVNVDNVFQLMRVPGVSQALAENIVMYRDRKGPFQRLDDLIRVKGISAGVLSAIRPYLVLDVEQYNRTQSTLCANTNGHLSNSVLTDSAIFSLPRSLQKSQLGNTEADLIHIGGPLSQKSCRTTKSSDVFHRDSHAIIRIATWNLEKFSSDKVMNPGVREVMCMTLFENGVRILAVQDIQDAKALHLLCEELNNPTIPNVCKWPGHRGSWKCDVSPEFSSDQSVGMLGFLYDTSQGVELKATGLLDVSGHSSCHCLRSPFYARFKVQDWHLTLVNAHVVIPRFVQLEDGKHHNGVILPSRDPLSVIASAIKKKLPDATGILLMGDFNIHLTQPGVERLKSRGFTNVLTESTDTNIRYSAVDVSSPTLKTQSTMWLKDSVQTAYTGLSNPWIPDGWSWGGVASSHCPLWAEFYTDNPPDGDTRRTSGDSSVKQECLTNSWIPDVWNWGGTIANSSLWTEFYNGDPSPPEGDTKKSVVKAHKSHRQKNGQFL
ncbi:hypothetical protein NP493_18g09023 [Ridgeia piscesae]|uniref:Endonuclease/exonuclease/phosphatase family domain-containing protein 1 n=1 Tax=Ridgeia piscesae TaxID=27915 RepID=A0AAD9UKM1_RIDPI|nr:hypothetical protein NP493_18g09023 [Ridgeia piscesae]